MDMFVRFHRFNFDMFVNHGRFYHVHLKLYCGHLFNILYFALLDEVKNCGQIKM